MRLAHLCTIVYRYIHLLRQVNFHCSAYVLIHISFYRFFTDKWKLAHCPPTGEAGISRVRLNETFPINDNIYIK
jgi:hypothetical protein